jgi:hypothetical protein
MRLGILVEGVEGVELASRQPEVGKKAGGLKRLKEVEGGLERFREVEEVELASRRLGG